MTIPLEWRVKSPILQGKAYILFHEIEPRGKVFLLSVEFDKFHSPGIIVLIFFRDNCIWILNKLKYEIETKSQKLRYFSNLVYIR